MRLTRPLGGTSNLRDENMIETKTERKIYSVSEITKGIRLVLEKTYPFVWVSGEISNLKKHGSGHWYLTLKDSLSQIRVVMFRGVNSKVKFDVENGLEIIIGGRVTVYDQQGQYQIVAEIMEPKGLGALQLAFEQLKAKLEKEGLFDSERKRPTPFLADKVGIVTSPTGAVIQDIINVTQRRFPGLPLLLYPVRVQGDGASEEIAAGIRYLNTLSDIDVLIVGRGGGSMEDLWPFNEEIVAREIFNSRIPVISAVGHETDWTIADFVADRRAPTPSAAAEMVAPAREELFRRIVEAQNRMVNGSFNLLKDKQSEVKRLLDSYAFKQPQNIIEQSYQQLDGLVREMVNYGGSFLKEKTMMFQNLISQLEALSPLGVLSRGYSLSLDEKGHVVRSIKNVKVGKKMATRVEDGTIFSIVEGVQSNE
jgi:exodeoxyribonuclease VII large subunit